MAVKWIEHKGITIMYSDFSGLKTDEVLLPALEETFTSFMAAPGKVRHLMNFTNAVITKKFMARAKEIGALLPKDKTIKDAYVGMEGLKKVLLNAFLFVTGEKAALFDVDTEAMNYLIND